MCYDKNGKWLEDNWNDKNMRLKYCLTYRKDEGFEIMFAINDDGKGLTGTKGWIKADGETFYEFWNNLIAMNYNNGKHVVVSGFAANCLTKCNTIS